MLITLASILRQLMQLVGIGGQILTAIGEVRADIACLKKDVADLKQGQDKILALIQGQPATSLALNIGTPVPQKEN